MFRTEGVSVTLDAKDVLSTSILQSTTKHLSDTIEWSENRDYEWASNFQLFELIFRISNHSYAFAQLLILALFENYRQYPSDLRELQAPPQLGQQYDPEGANRRDGL